MGQHASTFPGKCVIETGEEASELDPAVEAFMTQHGGIDEYTDCEIQYIADFPGPDLVLTSNGAEDRINLALYDSIDALHALFASRGLARSTPLTTPVPSLSPTPVYQESQHDSEGVPFTCLQHEIAVGHRCGPSHGASCGVGRCCHVKGRNGWCGDCPGNLPEYSNGTHLCEPIECMKHEDAVGHRCGPSHGASCGLGRCCYKSTWCGSCPGGGMPNYSNGANLCADSALPVHDEL